MDVDVGVGSGVDVGGMGVSVGVAEGEIVGVGGTGVDGLHEERRRTKTSDEKRKCFIENDSLAPL